MLLSSPTTSVRPCPFRILLGANFLSVGLISQVAEDLWEVKDKKVINLTKQDISIVDYKKALAKRSTSHFLFCLMGYRLTVFSQVKPRLRRLGSFPRVLPRVLHKSCSYHKTSRPPMSLYHLAISYSRAIPVPFVFF